MAHQTPLPKLTNKQPKCECGSGYMPTILEQSRNRWACVSCYGLHVPPPTHTDLMVSPESLDGYDGV